MNRRHFLKASAIGAASAALLPHTGAAQAVAGPSPRPGIVDTNVHLFDWPFRRLKYARTEALVKPSIFAVLPALSESLRALSSAARRCG
jgi:hypothetical protein